LLDAASNAGEQGKTGNSECDRDFLVAGQGGRDNQAAGVALEVDHGASVVLALEAKAATREQERSRGLAAALSVHAADTGL